MTYLVGILGRLAHADANTPNVRRVFVEEIGPEDARQLLERNVSNRPLSRRTAARYADDMRNGAWRFNGEPILFSSFDSGEVYLMDGQHRLHAIIESGTSQEMLCVILPVGQERDSIYETINTGRKRTLTDAVHTGKHRGQFTAMFEREIVAGINALSIADVLIPKGSGRFNALTNPARMAMFHANEETVLWAATIREKQPHGIRKIPYGVLAAAIMCYRKYPKEADRFFTSLATGANLAERSPILLLRNETLVAERVRGFTHEGRHLQWVGLALSAWQKWGRGEEEIQILRPLRKPFVVDPPTKRMDRASPVREGATPHER